MNLAKLIDGYEEMARQQQESVKHFNDAMKQYRKDGVPSFYDSADEVLALRKGARALRDAYKRFARELGEIEINLMKDNS